MRKNSQSGFAALEAILIIVVIAAVGFTGWFVWHSRQATEKTIATTNKPGESEQSDAANASASKLKLVDWSVEYSVPASLKSKLMVQPYSDGDATEYTFSLSPIDNNNTCKSYLESVDNGALPDVQINRVSVSEQASPLIVDGGKPMTLLEYYDAHKANDGTYFVPPHMDTKWWKLGSYLYYPASSPVVFDAQRAPKLAEKCSDVSENYQLTITDALATIKSY